MEVFEKLQSIYTQLQGFYNTCETVLINTYVYIYTYSYITTLLYTCMLLYIFDNISVTVLNQSALSSTGICWTST